jgi:hypothetical protein
MIGMIALAGIIVRNSILLVDFINIQVRQGVVFKEAVVHSAITRAQPIMLTGLAAMLGAFFILDDPIFNGLAISLIFGIFVSTLLTLVVIPVLYYVAYRKHNHNLSRRTRMTSGKSCVSSPAFSSCFRSHWAFRAARYSSANGGSRSPRSSAPICCKAPSPAGARWKPSSASSARARLLSAPARDRIAFRSLVAAASYDKVTFIRDQVDSWIEIQPPQWKPIAMQNLDGPIRWLATEGGT